MFIPESRGKLIDLALEMVERCMASSGSRALEAQKLYNWRYLGAPDNSAAMLNRLSYHIDRTASYLFSPSSLRFHIDFTHLYAKDVLDKAELASRVLTREFSRRDIDMQFGEGVDQALLYGSCIPKLVDSYGGITCHLVMPWNFGVYNETKNDLAEQEVVVEKSLITPFDLWRRLEGMPYETRRDLWIRAREHSMQTGASPGGVGADATGMEVILAGTSPMVQTEGPFSQQAAGQVTTSSLAVPNAVLDPQVKGEMITMYEMYINDDRTNDYITVQIAEPDILIAPRYRRRNLFIPNYLPYGFIQPNRTQGNLWGRSELADLLKLQHLLRDRMEDVKKLMSLQYDRLLGFTGESGMTDEMYDNSRQAGYFNLGPGSDIKDLTPKLPDAAFADIKQIMEMMDEVSGFANILNGQGESGVRAGNHAQMLIRTASPHLRDRALMVERQCADLGDRVLRCLAAKRAEAFWGRDGKDFLLEQLPDDLQVNVDSHSSSPIYEDDHQQIVAFLVKAQAITPEDALDLLLPGRERLKENIREQKAAQAKFALEHPELVQKGGKKK